MTIASHATKVTSQKLEVKSPLTGELLGTLPIHNAEAVHAAVARSRRAAQVWGALSFRERRQHLLDYRRELVRRMDDIIETVHHENGKTRADAAQELMLVLSHLTHAAKRAEAALAPRRVSSGLLANYRSTVSYQPLGVIGVIGPWNYPLHTPMGSISYALAAGNSVVFKPSELTPLSGKLLVECAQAAIPIPNLVELVIGRGEVGALLARAQVDKLAFTGSTATGRAVMAAAAESLTPVLLELGGKGAAIVTEDADLDHAADSVVYGSLMNGGQACISTERVLVVDAVYDAFVARVVERASALRWGAGEDAHYGAMTLERQIDRVREHVREALDMGARAVVGGLDSIEGRFIGPIVLVDVTPNMLVMREETFGPVLPIAKVASVDEAVRLANDSRLGLGSAVFARRGGELLANRLRTGMTSVNAVAAFAGIPGLPFGGIGDSGFGRIHGDEGLREFVHVKATAYERFPLPGAGLKFADPSAALETSKQMIRALYGRGGLRVFGSALRRLAGR